MLVESIEECEVVVFPAWPQELRGKQAHSSPTRVIQLVLITRRSAPSFLLPSRLLRCPPPCVVFLPIRGIIAGCSQAPPRQ